MKSANTKTNQAFVLFVVGSAGCIVFEFGVARSLDSNGLIGWVCHQRLLLVLPRHIADDGSEGAGVIVTDH